MIKPQQSQFRVPTRRHQPRGSGVLGHGEDRRLLQQRPWHAADQVARSAGRGAGQHFVFDAGNGDWVAFCWFADPPDRVPGISSPAAIPGIGDIVSAVSTMNHLAFHVSAEKFDEYRQRLKDKGVRVGPVLNHDESEMQVSRTVHPGVYVRSFYFTDPDGITLEFACWTKEFTESDAKATPRTAADRRPR